MTNKKTSIYTSPLCALLRRRREELRLTQAALAERLGVVSEAVGQWERAGRRMELNRLPQIAAALQLDVTELFALVLSEFHPALYAAVFGGTESEVSS